MTDNEIIKALKCCKSSVASCEECPMYVEGVICHGYELNKKALDLINRQRAAIEKLTINMNAFGLGMKREKENADIAKAKAIKEFAERLKETKFKHDNDYIIYAENIDVLVKEMVGDTE